ncbi:Rhs family protein [Beggiatoa sp. PS]|nr:Rhs family protein [Beggiatoa sp. PS]
MIKGPLSGELVDFAFDSRNRLTQASSTTYRYDAENQRIGVNQTQLVVNSQPNLSQVLVKTEADGKKTFYVYGLGLIGEETGSEYTSYHFDLRGSTVALSNQTAQIVERFQYSPYGVLLSENAEKTPFLFNGMYGVMTDSNGLYYMRARFYSPEMRRFVNQDILLGNIAEGQTLNRYAYVTGNPVSYVDPFGLKVEFDLKNPNYPFKVKPKDVLELAIRQILKNPAIKAYFNQLFGQKGQTIDDLLIGEELSCPININKDSFLTWLFSFISTQSRGHTRWDGVFIGKPWPNQPDKSIALALILFSGDISAKEAAALLIHELAHWIEAYALGKIAVQHPGYYDTGKYVESLIEDKYYSEDDEDK